MASAGAVNITNVDYRHRYAEPNAASSSSSCSSFMMSNPPIKLPSTYS